MCIRDRTQPPQALWRWMQNGLQRTEYQLLALPLEQGMLRKPRAEAGAPHVKNFSGTTGNLTGDAFDIGLYCACSLSGQLMQLPANFDSVSVDSVMSDWLCALREFSVEALLVLGPDPF